MIEVIFRRVSSTLSWPVPGGSRTIAAFSKVRNELNGERPDPSQLPDTETGVTMARTVGPVVMPRAFPIGSWPISGTEKSTEKWTSPLKVLTRAHQPVDVWETDALTGNYTVKNGAQFDDWAYWIHFCNGSHHTDGCIGVVNLSEFQEFAAMVQNALSSGIPIQVTAVDE
jgi:hypothetical protein